MKKRRKKKSSKNNILIILSICIIGFLVFALLYTLLVSDNHSTQVEKPVVEEKIPSGEANIEKVTTKTPEQTNPPRNDSVIKHKDEPTFTPGDGTFELNNLTYTTMLPEELFDFMNDSFNKLKDISTVGIKELQIEESGDDDERVKLQTLRDISIDYPNYFVKQIVQEKRNTDASVVTEEIFHTKDGIYRTTEEISEDGQKMVSFTPHEKKVSRNELIDSASLLDNKRTPLHMVESFTTKATLPIGLVYGENEQHIALVKKSEEEYFGATNLRYEIYVFDKNTLLPTSYFEFQKQIGNSNDYTTREITYQNWNKLKELHVPNDYLEATKNTY